MCSQANPIFSNNDLEPQSNKCIVFYFFYDTQLFMHKSLWVQTEERQERQKRMPGEGEKDEQRLEETRERQWSGVLPVLQALPTDIYLFLPSKPNDAIQERVLN